MYSAFGASPGAALIVSGLASRFLTGTGAAMAPRPARRSRAASLPPFASSLVQPLSLQLPALSDLGAWPGARLSPLRGQKDRLFAVPEREEPSQEPWWTGTGLLPQELRGR